MQIGTLSKAKETVFVNIGIPYCSLLCFTITHYMSKKRYLGIAKEVVVLCIYVTEFWKIDQIVTLDLFHFIGGPANGYTCTLHIHSAIAGLD